MENIVQAELYIIILLYAVFDIFLVMYLANDITVASDRLSYCLFESNWMDESESCKKLVLIMGEVLKQPQQLVILIYPLNLETFTRVSEKTAIDMDGVMKFFISNFHQIANGAYNMFNILKNF